MCLGIPGRVVAVLPGNAGQLALVDVAGAARPVNIGMLDRPPEKDEWVLIHMGFAVELIDADQAALAMSGLELMGQARETAAAGRIRRRYVVSGLVQGVGFRPFAYATAAALALAGSVANTADGVVIEVEGDPDAVAEYARRLRADAPPLAMVTRIDGTDLPLEGGTGFTIAASGPSGPARTLASPDVAICADCERELRDPADRRHRHPFISCTNCGPRFTIITSLPYDRAATTMAGFPMCTACRAEYSDPADRRFHAQPIACPACGPRLQLVTSGGEVDTDALVAARRMLAAGRIVAVKGLGGYHLACDARNEAAVAELRRRKQRGGKPFAVMVADAAAARNLVALGPAEESLLAGIRRPIVLLPRLPGADVAAAVAPDSCDLGVLLPYTPLHVLLFGLDGDEPGPDVLVMTSGNLSGEPIVTGDDEALDRLGALADAWLRHDRPIRVPCDDSVSRLTGGAELPVRRSRGHAPLPLVLPFDIPPALAAGADLKNTCALGAGRYVWLSQHIGDTADLSTMEAMTRTEAHLEMLTGVRPETVAADLHPDYRSAAWARAFAGDRPVRLVQHHHAHIASVMAEHGIEPGEQVIGFAFDGTGYGLDGAIWGGEVLVCDYKAAERVAHLAYVPLAGGDASVRRPYRMALTQLHAAGVPWRDDLAPVAECPPAERTVLARQLETGFGCVPTSSMGRLFDAVASLAGLRHVAAYEGEAAMMLEGAARARGPAVGAYGFEILGEQVDAAPLIRAVVADLHHGVPAGEIAARFHAAVTDLIVALAERTRARTGLDVVAFGGGVFQNTLLIDAARDALTDRGFTVLVPHALPPNDGGLALGQLVIAAAG